ncbi:YqaA family protein [Glaciecola sp. 1036]|uniref:YqaA family protein n=1 Tax=Alteromonadaceae TaxID=72275 RepID=UPI003D08A169
MSIKKRVKRMIESKHMLTSIGIASFLESTVVPIPLETILIPLMQAKREKIWQIAAVTTIGCILGAILGYAIGYFLFDALRDLVMTYITNEEQFSRFEDSMDRNGFWFVFSTGVTPVPLQIAMLAAGVTGYSLTLYLVAVTISRSIRYFGLALLVKIFGNKTEKIVRKYKWQAIAVATATIVVIVAVKIWLSSNGN